MKYIELTLSEDKAEATRQVLELYKKIITDNKPATPVKIYHKNTEVVLNIPLELHAFYQGMILDFSTYELPQKSKRSTKKMALMLA